jgi:hypothetical protein
VAYFPIFPTIKTLAPPLYTDGAILSKKEFGTLNLVIKTVLEANLCAARKRDEVRSGRIGLYNEKGKSTSVSECAE